MSFKNMCLKYASDEHIQVDDTSLNIPDGYKRFVEWLIAYMKPKMHSLDTISIDFIEKYFEDVDDLTKLLNDNTNDEEIPDSVINVLSNELYDGKSVDELTDDEQAIIKVLSVYICIQKSNSGGINMNMVNVKNNANLVPRQKAEFAVSSSDIIRYLEGKLRFKFAAYDFMIWNSAVQGLGYVRMRVVMRPEDVVHIPNTTSFVDKFLAANAVGLEYRDDVMDVLPPFMYPNTIGNLWNDPASLQRLEQQGIYGERLMELVNHHKPVYDKNTNTIGLYIRPEKIISDMLADPDTGRIDGNMVIGRVDGDRSAPTNTVTWHVTISKENSTTTTGIQIDRIFNF